MGEGERAILAFRDAILEAWEKRVRVEIKPLKDVDPLILLNSFPPFLELLARSMSFKLVKDDFLAMALKHGAFRAGLEGVTAQTIRSEYDILKECIYDRLGDLHLDAADVDESIEDFIDKAAKAAVHNFIKQNQPK